MRRRSSSCECINHWGMFVLPAKREYATMPKKFGRSCLSMTHAQSHAIKADSRLLGCMRSQTAVLATSICCKTAQFSVVIAVRVQYLTEHCRLCSHKFQNRDDV